MCIYIMVVFVTNVYNFDIWSSLKTYLRTKFCTDFKVGISSEKKNKWDFTNHLYLYYIWHGKSSNIIVIMIDDMQSVLFWSTSLWCSLLLPLPSLRWLLFPPDHLKKNNENKKLMNGTEKKNTFFSFFPTVLERSLHTVSMHYILPCREHF